MKTTGDRLKWKKILRIAIPSVLGLGLLIWLCSDNDLDDYYEELRQTVADMNRDLGDLELDEDFSKINREAAAALTARFQSELKGLEAEKQQQQDAYNNISRYFPGGGSPVMVATQDDVNRYMDQRKRVNAYLDGIRKKSEAILKRSRNEYEQFRQQGKTGPANPDLSLPNLEGLDKLRYTREGEDKYQTESEQKALETLAAYGQKFNLIKTKINNGGYGNEPIGKEVRRWISKLADDEESILALAEKRKAFYSNNVADGKLTAKEELRGAMVDEERFNLCLAPEDALKALEAFTLPTFKRLDGDLIARTNVKREFSEEAADCKIAATADIGPSLLQPLLAAWAAENNMECLPWDKAGNGASAPDRNSKNWVVLKNAAGKLCGKNHADPFTDEFWIYMKPVTPGDNAAALMADGQADLVMTGDEIPAEALKDSTGRTRKYDQNYVVRLCSDAVLFVNCSNSNKSALNLDQVLGQKTSEDTPPRVFFPDCSHQRHISNRFNLLPVQGKDKILDTCDMQQAFSDAKQDKGGTLIAPRHLCPNNVKAYAFALPTIKSSGKIVTDATNRYARPSDANCYPDEDRIRSHDYLLSYDICLYRTSGNKFATDFLAYCNDSEGAQATISRSGYVALRSGNDLQFGRLTSNDLPVAIVIEQLAKAKATLGYKNGDTFLKGVKLSNVAFFETNSTNPKEERVEFDIAHQKGLRMAIEHLLSPGVMKQEFAIVLVGHADVRGDDKYNVNLSEQRACSAVENILYQVNGKEKLCNPSYIVGKKQTHGVVSEILYNNTADKISIATLGCGYWRPLTTDSARERAKKSESDKETANDILHDDRRVEFFIIVPKK